MMLKLTIHLLARNIFFCSVPDKLYLDALEEKKSMDSSIYYYFYKSGRLIKRDKLLDYIFDKMKIKSFDVHEIERLHD